MTLAKKYFGTDGIRGLVGSHPISPDFMLKLGWAAGKVMARSMEKQGENRVLIGKDTRISGYMFESALEAGLSAAGMDVWLLGPMPTPGIAYLTRAFRATAGIVVSASHNPYFDNGIKFFSSQGRKLPDAVELAIEAQLDCPIETVSSERLGKALRVDDAAGRYIEFCKSTLPFSTSFAGVRIVLDCANGATYHIAPAVFKELGADVIVIAAEPDGLNINENCGSTQPQRLAEEVLAHKADLGIALDGDGDRVTMVDHLGEIVDGDQILFIIAEEARCQQRLTGGVVGTVMSNLGLELALANIDVPFERVQVGDRYVMEKLYQNGWNLGGETSGHIAWLGAQTTGDGIVAALQAMAPMMHLEKTLHELKQGMVKFPQTLLNVRVKNPFNPMSNPAIAKAVQVAKRELGSRGRILLRPSGTEPVIRVMVEGENEDQVEGVAHHLALQVGEVTTQALA